jgi:glucose-1-phosphate thymidylyltransferase
MKGIILAGGTGSRLYPITKGVSKHLIPIYDKPMIYYPMSVLMLAGIKEILIISNPEFIDMYRNIFGDGSQLGMNISYAVQDEPRGLADAFIVGKEFIGNDSVALVLGDNVFYGQGFGPVLKKAASLKEGAVIFGYYVNNPSDFGIVEFDENKNVVSLEEKPKHPKSHYAIPGLYFYDEKVVDIAKNLKPSSRGEIEITDLNKKYLKMGKLGVELLGRGFAWLDTGTADGLANASDFVRTIQKRQGLYIGCLEEVAFNKGFIDKNQLLALAKGHNGTEYGEYLKDLVKNIS